MTLSKKLGKQFEQIKDDIQIKKISINLGDVKFDLKIKVPLKKEMEQINSLIFSPPKEKVDRTFDRIAAPMLQTLEEGGEEFIKALNSNKQSVVVTDDDLIMDGVSLRQVAQYQAIEEIKIEQYFHLLVSELGNEIDESYEQICAEFPEFVIKEIVESIQAAIAPDYKNAKKN